MGARARRAAPAPGPGAAAGSIATRDTRPGGNGSAARHRPRTIPRSRGRSEMKRALAATALAMAAACVGQGSAGPGSDGPSGGRPTGPDPRRVEIYTAAFRSLAETESWFDPVLLDDRICPDIGDVRAAPGPCEERFTEAEQAAILAGLDDLPGIRFVDDAGRI